MKTLLRLGREQHLKQPWQMDCLIYFAISWKQGQHSLASPLPQPLPSRLLPPLVNPNPLLGFPPSRASSLLSTGFMPLGERALNPILRLQLLWETLDLLSLCPTVHHTQLFSWFPPGELIKVGKEKCSLPSLPVFFHCLPPASGN